MLLKAEDVLSIKGIKWLHIPAYSPSKGGIWEAGVKSVKFFLKRMEDSSTMTYEDFNTALCKIEALLNSRPMYPLFNNPEELEALTPAHFAIQRTFLHAPAAPPYQEDGLLVRKWNHLQEIQRQFWEKFNQEYIDHLQRRYKWQHPKRNPQVGDLVLLKTPNTAIAQWKMGRILFSRFSLIKVEKYEQSN